MAQYLLIGVPFCWEAALPLFHSPSVGRLIVQLTLLRRPPGYKTGLVIVVDSSFIVTSGFGKFEQVGTFIEVDIQCWASTGRRRSDFNLAKLVSVYVIYLEFVDFEFLAA